MDRIKDSGSFDKGSIPLGCTKRIDNQMVINPFIYIYIRMLIFIIPVSI